MQSFPFDWFWVVNGDARFWSSRANAYIATLPDSDIIPSAIGSEQALTLLLDKYGLAGPTPADLSIGDQASLNAALIAQGGVVRALGLVMFAEINKLRVKNGDPVYTLAQFKTALQAQMRG